MLNSLRIRNFRLFDELEIPTIGRVNLVVGKNNSGKSSVLEALRIFASQGEPSTLLSILGSHDENLRFDNPLASGSREDVDTSYRHFFPRRNFPETDGAAIYIGDDSQQSFVQLEHRLFFETFEEVTDEDGDTLRRRKRSPIEKNSPQLFENDITPEQALFITTKQRAFWLDLADSPIGMRRRFRIPASESREIPYVYVPTDFITGDQLATMWDRAALTEAENYLLSALRIIEQDISGLAFVRKEDVSSSFRDKGESRVAIVKIEGHSSPIPLASMGDGMTRLLQLVLSIFSAKGGMLLLDEFENGLHYSVQRKAWDLVLHLAKELDVQVFATTHSNDCINAFSQASTEDNQVDGMLFRLGKSVQEDDQSRIVATVFNENKLERFTQSSLEVR